MKVRHVIALAKRWVEENGSRFPGFRGAYLAGSINELGKEEPFPAFKDVDIYIVVEDIAQIAKPHEKLLYEGVLLEAACFSAEESCSPETVLASLNAGNLVSCELLADPTGLLEKTRKIVAQEYTKREWVTARCKAQKQSLLGSIEAMGKANSADEALESLCWMGIYLGGLIAVSCLRTPTIRRCLALAGELLQDRGRSELHEEILHLWGCSHPGREDVIRYLESCVQAFERAVAVVSTSFVGSWNLHPFIRPYLVDGSYEMINAGSHREAMFWISGMRFFSHKAIQNDGQEVDRCHYQGGMDRLQAELGISTAPEWKSRMALAKSVSERVIRFADEVVEEKATKG